MIIRSPRNLRSPSMVLGLWLGVVVALPANEYPDPAAKDHWSFKPFKEQPLPAVKQKAWPLVRADHFVLARMESEGLFPNGEANAPTLLRRLYFDLTGLPPTLEEIADFEKAFAENRDEALRKTVDRLLASPDFGVRWARHWLDVARYAESSGNTRNMAYPEAWRFRNYVIRAFNRNVPFDQFIREQVAGDLLPAASPAIRDEQVTATGFLAIGTKSLGEKSLIQYDLDSADDQIDATFHAFLGLSANCARCHNHKFDPIPTKDYYSLVGIFRSTQLRTGVITNSRAEEGDGMPLGADGQTRMDEIKRIEKLIEGVTAESAEAGKKRTAVKDELAKAGIKPTAKSPVDASTLSPELAEKLAELQSLDAKVASFASRLKELKESMPAAPEITMAAQDKAKPFDSPLYYKGQEKDPKEAVPRGTLTVIPVPLAPIAENESGRRQLADWIAHPANPLTGRVIVNRIWLHVFGRGIVETPDDFGWAGMKPSHPELLDDLAANFVRNGWDVKGLIRELMLSRTYRMSSAIAPDAKGLTVDAGNVLLWRASRKAMEFEPVRDSILLLGGKLKREVMEGSPIKELSKPVRTIQRELGRRGFLSKLDDTDDYRSIYLPALRGSPLPVQQCFEGADPSSIVGARRASIVPSQALFLMNSDFVMKHADGFAHEIFQQTDVTPEQRITTLWRMAYTRSPTRNEIAEILKFVGDAQDDPGIWSRVCQVLMMAAEFRTVY